MPLVPSGIEDMSQQQQKYLSFNSKLSCITEAAPNNINSIIVLPVNNIPRRQKLRCTLLQQLLRAFNTKHVYRFQ